MNFLRISLSLILSWMMVLFPIFSTECLAPISGIKQSDLDSFNVPSAMPAGDLSGTFVVDGVSLFPLITPTAVTHMDFQDPTCIKMLSEEEASDVAVLSGTQVFIFLPGVLKDLKAMSALTQDQKELKKIRFRKNAGIVRLGELGDLKNFPGNILLPYIERTHQKLVEKKQTRDFYIWINTSMAETSDDVIRLARWGLQETGSPYIKMEVRDTNLMTKNEEILEAVQRLVALNSDVKILPLIGKQIELSILDHLLSYEQIIGLRIEGTKPGSSQGMGTQEDKIKIQQLMASIKKVRSNIPLIAECGIGTPAQAEEALEMGFNAVLVNAAITQSEDPVATTLAFSQVVQRVLKESKPSGLPYKPIVNVAA
jgi:thiazole synthase